MSTLVMIHCAAGTGYAIGTLERILFEAALQVEDGDPGAVHMAWRSLPDGPPGFLPPETGVIEHDLPSPDGDALRAMERYVDAHGIRRAIGFDLGVENPTNRALRRGGARRVVAYWGAPMSSLNRGMRLLVKRVEVALRRDRPDHFVFESEAMRQTAVQGRGVPENDTSVIRLGVDTDRFRPFAGAPRLPEELGISPDRFVAFFSGHMEPRKGVAVLMEAALRLVDDLGDDRFHFLLCGNRGREADPYLGMLQGSSAAEHVTFAGYRDDIPELMRNCDAGVIASTGWDSFTMSAAEMAASGLPMLVSDLQGLREAVAPDETGWTFPVGDARALADHLRRLAAEPETRGRMAAAARRRAETLFSRERQVHELAGVLAS